MFVALLIAFPWQPFDIQMDFREQALDKSGTSGVVLLVEVPKLLNFQEPADAGSWNTEREGFEPSVPLARTTVFETGPFDRSGISPEASVSPISYGRELRSARWTLFGLAGFS